ncbi:ABC transporter substrate-binding protein [Arthrobacter sp. D1-29]
MKRFLMNIVATGTTALLLAGCASAGSGPSDADAADESDGPIKIAIVYGLTGAFAGTGSIFMTGFDAAVKHLNDEGGIKGRQIEVKLLDSKSDPTHAVSVLTELLDSGYDPDVIIPGGVSSEVLAMLPLATDAKLFSVAPGTNSAINDHGAYPHHIGSLTPASASLSSVARSFTDDGIKTLGVVLPGDAFGDSLLSGITAIASDAGVKIVQVERPDPAALNFDVEVQRVKSAAPDAMFFDFAGHDSLARLLSSRVAVGATDIPFYGGTGAAAAVLSNLAEPSALENCSLPVYSFTVTPDSPADHLKPLYAAFADSDVGILAGALGWDVVHLAALAIERTDGDTSGDALIAAIRNEPVPGDYLALYPGGVTYSEDDVFPTPAKGAFGLVECGASVKDGLWVE